MAGRFGAPPNDFADGCLRVSVDDIVVVLASWAAWQLATIAGHLQLDIGGAP